MAASVVTAQAPASQLEPVVVTATRNPVPLNHVLSDVSVINREEIERHGAGGVVDVLRSVAGLQMVRNGGPGGNTSLSIRGGDQRFTAVMIDGVRVDSQSTGGATWEAIPLSQIDRIEILRGPASGLYGSDAMSGVVQIFTRKGEGGVGLDAGLGVGSHHTSKADASLSGTSGPLDFSMSAANENSHGFNATVPSSSTAITDRDGYWSRSVSGRLGLRLTDAHRVEVSALDNNVHAQYDATVTSSAPFKDDRSIHDLQTLHALWSAQWTKAWRSALSAGQADDIYQTRPALYNTFTRVKTYAWQNDVAWGPHSVQAIVERREDQLENEIGKPAAIERQRSQDAFGLGYGWRHARWALQAQLRSDDDSEFGRHSTGSLAAGADIAAGWRVRSSVGTGFRAPTLFQRFGASGPNEASPKLKPERSRNVEFGLHRSQGNSHLGVTAFDNRLSDLIAFGPPGTCADTRGCYASIAHARLSGLTVEGRTVWAGLRLSGSFDLLSAKNTDTDKWLARRARRTGSLQIDKDLGDWNLGAQWLAVGKRFDDADNTRTLGGYSVLNVDAQVGIANDWRLQARVDNVFDKDYNTANRYLSAPLSLFIGVRWSPKL